MSDLERVSVTIEKKLLRQFDHLMHELGAANRSEAVRDLIRARLLAESWKDDDAPVVATVTLVYDHEKRALADQLVSAAHDHHGLVLATMHVHLDAHHCLEVTALRGKAGAVRHLAGHMVGMKGVQHGQIVLTGSPG